MDIDLSRFRDAFFEEAAEHLQTIEALLLELERGARDPDLLHRIFRSAHSIKGAAGSFGFEEVGRLTHALEGLLDAMREGEVPPSPASVGVLLRAADRLGDLLRAARDGEAPPGGTDAVIAALDRERGALAGAAAVREGGAGGAAPGAGEERTVRVRFEPAPDLLRAGLDPLLLLRELASLGEVVEARIDPSRLPPIGELDPETCYLAFDWVLRTSRPEEELRDVFAFAEEGSVIEIRILDGGRGEAEAGSAADEVAPGETAEADLAEAGVRALGLEGSSIRVPKEKLDQLIDLVGEVIIAQAMVSQAARDPSPEGIGRLQEAVAEMERNTRELQQRVMAVRMVPIGTIFQRFPRLVRDLAATCGRRVALHLAGEETELDKGVIERIGDPLTHLIRNAVDHGIEPPEERLAAGKPEEGRIELAAYHEGGSVVIEIADDGRGLDAARIRSKALRHGLIGPGECLTDEEAYALIFRPGFSTADAVTSVSGRGVGMDVVKRNVEEMGGSIGLSSEPGRGMRLRIRLPLTMAILDGLAVGVGERTYVLPLASIVEFLRPTAREFRSILGRGEAVMLRGEPVPLVWLHRALGHGARAAEPGEALVVIAESEGTRIALAVDELLGQSQVVIKNLEHNFRRVDGVMGATILGDGRVALILDVQGLSRLAVQGAGAGDERGLAAAGTRAA